jgi:DNA polymerase V
MTAPIWLVDCNNFYASCERLFQPGLRGKPVVVLSNNDGCVIARSNEAKALGIAMGEAWHVCRQRVDTAGVIVRSSNYTLYGDLSARVMRTLADHTPELEIYSIDEAFLRLDGFGDRLESHARALRRTVQQCTGIPVSIGIAPTKTLAKVANRRAKKDPSCDGVFLMMDEAGVDAELGRLELTDLWGVAGRLAARLQALGITTPLALKQADPRFIRERLSVTLERTVRELNGVPCIALEDGTPDRKSIMASRSFGRMVETLPDLREAVATFTSRAAEKMRRQGLVTPRLMVFAHTNRFRAADPQYYAARAVTLPVATADSGKLIAAAWHGLAAIFLPCYRYKKAGIVLLDLLPAGDAQPSLFDALDDAPTRSLMRALDGLNRRYGRDTVYFAATGIRRQWKLRSEFLSPRYTTCWDELLTVTDGPRTQGRR